MDVVGMYAEKISQEGMVSVSSTKSDMWLILFLRTNWDDRGNFIELTLQAENRNFNFGYPC